jgi:hypothetical protein
VSGAEGKRTVLDLAGFALVRTLGRKRPPLLVGMSQSHMQGISLAGSQSTHPCCRRAVSPAECHLGLQSGFWDSGGGSY